MMEMVLNYCPVQGGYLVQIDQQKGRVSPGAGELSLFKNNRGRLVSCQCPDLVNFYVRGSDARRDQIVMPIGRDMWKRIVQLVYEFNSSRSNNSLDCEDMFVLDESLITQYPDWGVALINDYGKSWVDIQDPKWTTKGGEDETEAYCQSVQ